MKVEKMSFFTPAEVQSAQRHNRTIWQGVADLLFLFATNRADGRLAVVIIIVVVV